MNRIRTAVLGLAIFAITSFTCLTPQSSAQIFGIPAPKIGSAYWENAFSAFPEERPLFIAAWSRAAQPNPDGNQSEKWISKPELQEVFRKVKTLLIKSADKSDDSAAAIWLKGPVWEVIENGGMLCIEGVNREGKMTGVSFVSSKYGADTIKDLLANFAKGNYQEIKVGNDKVHISPANSDGKSMVFGFHRDHLIVTGGKEFWGKVATRIDTEKRAPDWARDILAKQKIRRLGGFAYDNFIGWKNMLEAAGPRGRTVQQIMERTGIESIFIGWGTDEISNIGIVDVQGSSTGLLSSIDVAPMTTKQFDEIPADCSMAFGIKLSPENILKLLQEFLPHQPLEKMKPVEFIKANFEIDLKSEILDHLEGDIRAFSSGSLIKPKVIGVIGIKDEEAFRPAFENINSQVKTHVEQSGAKFSEKTGRDGITVYSFNPPLGSSVFWAIHESELLFGSNNRAIGSFVRKRASRSDPLTKQTLLATILKSDQPEDSKGAFMLQMTDVNQFLETLLPMAPIGLQFIPPESGIDISADDIPSPEDLAGLRPNVSIGFKTKSGVKMVSRYDTPVSIEAGNGILLGILLPAIEQVREAARRTKAQRNATSPR